MQCACPLHGGSAPASPPAPTTVAPAAPPAAALAVSTTPSAVAGRRRVARWGIGNALEAILLLLLVGLLRIALLPLICLLPIALLLVLLLILRLLCLVAAPATAFAEPRRHIWSFLLPALLLPPPAPAAAPTPAAAARGCWVAAHKCSARRCAALLLLLPRPQRAARVAALDAVLCAPLLVPLRRWPACMRTTWRAGRLGGLGAQHRRCTLRVSHMQSSHA